MDIAIKEAQPPPAPDMKQREMLPELAAWEQAGHLVHEIERILERAGQAGAGFRDAARFLHSGVAAQPRPIEFLETAIANCRSLLAESSVVMQSAVVERGRPWPFSTVLSQAHLAHA